MAWSCGVLLIAAASAAADPVTVRFPEGTTHGFLVLRSLQGQTLAQGELVATPHGDRMESRLTWRFRDGSLQDEFMTYSQRPVLKLFAYKQIQRGPSFPADVEVSFSREPSHYAVKQREQGKKDTEELSGALELPADVYNGMTATILNNLTRGETATGHVVAFTPKPMLIQLQFIPSGTQRLMIGTHPETAVHFILKPKLGALTSLMAKVLGKMDDLASYTSLLQKIKDAFVKEYMTPNGRLVSGTQTAYVLSLNFDMLPESLREQAANRLVDNVRSYNYHLTTGFLGTPYLCHVLSRFGHTDVAYKLLLQQTYPSWLYPVKMGATTIWERWDGLKPDSTFQTPGMNSFNHYSYGAIGDWMYRVVAGIDTYSDKPGYKHIKIMPHTGEGLSSAAADLQTYYGNVSSHWKQENGKFVLDVEIPSNTTATVAIPASDANLIQENGKALSSIKEIQVGANENGYVLLNVGSSKYHFEVGK